MQATQPSGASFISQSSNSVIVNKQSFNNQTQKTTEMSDLRKSMSVA